jgi:hypothetical protein
MVRQATMRTATPAPGTPAYGRSPAATFPAFPRKTGWVGSHKYPSPACGDISSSDRDEVRVGAVGYGV